MNKLLRAFSKIFTRGCRQFCGIASKSALFADLASLVQLFSSWRRNRYRDISTPSVITLTIALAYIAFPFDILPDIIPFLGWIDDIAVLKLVADSLRHEIKRFRVWQQWMEETAKANSSSHT